MRTFKLVDFDEAIKILGFPQSVEEAEKFSDDLAEWIEEEGESFDGPIGILVELESGVFKRLVHVEHHVEPEDAWLWRDFSWVIDELNRLGAVVPPDAKLD